MIDSFDSWLRAFNEGLERFGKTAIGSDEFRRRCWGPDLETNIRDFGLGKEAAEYIVNRYAKHTDRVKIFGGAVEVLGRLKDEFKLGLVTNTPAESTERIMRRFGLEKYFDVIVTGDDVKNPKPDPEIVRKACNYMNLKPDEVVLVGDTESDVAAGRSSGCKVIGLGVHGDFEIEKLRDLYDLLDVEDSSERRS